MTRHVDFLWFNYWNSCDCDDDDDDDDEEEEENDEDDDDDDRGGGLGCSSCDMWRPCWSATHDWECSSFHAHKSRTMLELCTLEESTQSQD